MVSHHYSSDDVKLKKLKDLLYVLKSDWLPKLVEPRPSKNFGSNEPWDLGLRWEPVLYWHCWYYNFIDIFEFISEHYCFSYNDYTWMIFLFILVIVNGL